MTLNPPGKPEERSVSKDIIREAFNSGQFWERAQQGEFNLVLQYDKHYPLHEAARLNHPYCSRSQIVRYYDELGQVAVVHQIRSPDGSLGASGKPDPKYLRLDDMILKTN